MPSKSQNRNNYIAQRKRAVTRKLQLISDAGGKCSKCGYKKNMAALAFHHTDPNLKTMKLDSRHLSNSTMEKILSEVGNCVLLCHNCHAELHNPSLSLDRLLEASCSDH